MFRSPTYLPHGGEPHRPFALPKANQVSTHSPRGRRTFWSFWFVDTASGFNSLAPRGANPRRKTEWTTIRTFQLTRPAGGEPYDSRIAETELCVSTHSPRGGRTRKLRIVAVDMIRFNSLAPRGANQK